MIPEGSFKPMVMFFGLTNSFANFQTMMNEILWNLINTKKMASFINNVIIRTEREEGHEELVEEVENDLYMKPEKCKWKVKEVEFLEVIIGPERIKIEEKKVKGVLDWLTPKGGEDIQ